MTTLSTSTTTIFNWQNTCTTKCVPLCNSSSTSIGYGNGKANKRYTIFQYNVLDRYLCDQLLTSCATSRMLSSSCR